jgi:lipopolysaccharide transport system ATP-binding protein
MTTVIKVENLSKKYLINHEKKTAQYETFAETLVQKSKNIAKKIIHPFKGKEINSRTQEEFWALNDINFEINQGDKVGIIGRNGAGKSTLLKLLSRITEPTNGKIHINGRIASLLEVGTGFHPELTGRENIYLNGAILGMSRKEIKAKFDEIVAFAEVEKFLDTPVKRYSSGMYVRLAFAVAAHLEPDILVVDEVLAVGDVEFQKKCLGKMEDVSKDGRTILFVSHNMNAIKQLCSKAILLDKGAISFASDDVDKVIHHYFSRGASLQASEWKNIENKFKNEYFKPLNVRITDEVGNIVSMPITNNKNHFIEIEAEIKELNDSLTIGYCIYTQDGQQLYWSYQTDSQKDEWPTLKKGINILRSQLPKQLLNEGTYNIELIGGLHFIKWLFEPRKNNPSIVIDIQGGISQSPYMTHKRPTILSPILKWENVSV